MRQLVGVIGSGNIGRDPFHSRSWSGLSAAFFTELQKQGLLRRAFGVEAPRWKRYLYMARNMRLDRKLWRERFYMDTRYRDALTREIGARIEAEDLQHHFLQIGGMYDVPQLLDGKAHCFSYHDGNLAELIRSPNAPRGLGARRIDCALAYERKIYEGMSLLFVMSEYLRESFINDFGLPEERVLTVGAGVNLRAVPPHYPNKNCDGCEILFMGVDFERKGGWTLLEAFRGVREGLGRGMLHIVGPASLAIPPRLRAGVRFHGFLDREEPAQRSLMNAIFRRCCLFVMPSFYEPFGVAPLEAMVHQIPCLVTNRWALREMVTPGVNGELVECGKVDELESKMLALLSDPERLLRMGENAREKVLRYYTWEGVVQRMNSALAQWEQTTTPAGLGPAGSWTLSPSAQPTALASASEP
jgi:glycosyltransferase involved in cell wall biosynthesis